MAKKKPTKKTKLPRTTAAAQTLSPEDLLAEGRALARQCVLLSTTPDRENPSREVAGYWRGAPVAAPPRGRFVHWLSVDARRLPSGSRTGWVSMFTNEADPRGGVVVPGPAPRRPPRDGTPLYGRVAESLPPLEAVFQLGSARVGQWLEQNGWRRDCPYNDNFAGRATAQSYLRAWMASCALYMRDVHAVLGGWHMLWPDDDGYDPARRLALWTIAESEPWVEAFEDDASFLVVERIT